MAALRPKDLFDAAYGLAGDARDPSEELIGAWMRDARPREIAIVAAAARTGFRYGVWPDYTPPRAPIARALLEGFRASVRPAIAALLSMHRNGYVRELAFELLASSPDARVVPFLLLRADDVVPSLRERAERAVLDRLRPELAAVFARSLGLIEMLAARVRGAGGPLVRAVRDFLARPAHRGALIEACGGDDPVVRRAAFALRLRAEPAEEVLRAALGDPHTGIRRFAARTVVSRATTREEKLALLPLLAAAGAPSLRILALRGWQSVAESDAPIEAALLDPNGAVRYLARSILRARRPDQPFGETRLRALHVLAEPRATSRELVGALGALADVGLRRDVDAARPFADDPRSRVRGEARRAMTLLQR